MGICNQDCFNCIYPDCIWDKDAMSWEDRKEAKEIEANYILFNDISRSNRRLETQLLNIKIKQGVYKIKQKAYREAHKEELKAKQKAYYEANREKLNTQRREHYTKQRAAKKLAQQVEKELNTDEKSGKI